MNSTTDKRASKQNLSAQNGLSNVSQAFLYRTIVNAEPECVKTIDADGFLLHMNPAGLKYIEADNLEDVKGACVYDLVTPECRDAFIDLNRRVFQGETANLVFEIEGLKGTRRWMETHAVPIFDTVNKEEVVAHIAVTHDISDRLQSEKALKESEERFRSIFEGGPSGIAIANNNGTVLQVNDALCRFSGYSKDELLGKNFREFLHPDEIATSVEKLRQLFSGEINHYSLIRRYRHKQKHYIWTEANISVIHDADNKPSLLINHLQDINDRYQTEKLQDIQRRIFELIVSSASRQEILEFICRMFTSLFAEDINSLILTYDGDDRCFNVASAPDMGEILPCSISSMVSSEKLTKEIHSLNKGDSLIIEDVGNKKGLKKFQSVLHEHQVRSCWLVPFFAQHENMEGLFVVTLPNNLQPSKQDHERLQTVAYLISIAIERVRALEELRENQVRFQGAFSNAPMGTALVDNKGVVLQANSRSSDIIGFKPEELVGRSIADVSHPDDLEISIARFRALMSGEIEAYQLEKQYRHKLGGYVWCRLSISSIKAPDGKPQYAIAHIEDISERKKFEQELLRSNRALQMLNSCKEVLFHANDEQELLQKICNIAIETGGYRFAWIGYAELDEKKTIKPVASAGFEQGYLNTSIYWSRYKDRFCPIAEAILTRKPCVIRNVETEKKNIIWREEALARNYQSTVALPLQSELGAFGALVIYSMEKDAFDEDEISLLSNLTENLSFGIQSITNRSVREQAEQSLRMSEKRFRQLFDENPCMFFTVDENAVVKSVNDFGAEELGYRKEEIVGHSLFHFTETNQYFNVTRQLKMCIANLGSVQRWEMQATKHDGSALWVKVMARAVENSESGSTILVVCEDITEARNLSKQLKHQATHDKLTGLINRHEFEVRLERALESAKQNNIEHVLCYIDLDQFKIVNDTCGHLAGDSLLEQLSELLNSKVRHRDSLARLGGDEFGLLIENCSLQAAERVTNDIKNSIAGFLFHWEDKTFKIGASIGIVSINKNSASGSELLMHADTACYTAKDKGRNRIHVHEEGDSELEDRRKMMLWTTRIEQAFRENRFRLAYQPIVPVTEQASKGEHGEVLVRMLDDNGELIGPDQFISVAERYGLITRIDRHVIELTFKWLESNQDFLERLYLISINISGSSLANDDFVDVIPELLHQYNIPANKVCFEITETAAISNFASAARFVDTLKQHGCLIALDDFGSGLSSFGYLKRLPIDFLKIDGGFVCDIENEEMDLAIVKSIHDIGKAFNKKTIAEFIENDNIREILKDVGVDFGQGYAIQKPVPINEINPSTD